MSTDPNRPIQGDRPLNPFVPSDPDSNAQENIGSFFEVSGRFASEEAPKAPPPKWRWKVTLLSFSSIVQGIKSLLVRFGLLSAPKEWKPVTPENCEIGAGALFAYKQGVMREEELFEEVEERLKVELDQNEITPELIDKLAIRLDALEKVKGYAPGANKRLEMLKALNMEVVDRLNLIQKLRGLEEAVKSEASTKALNNYFDFLDQYHFLAPKLLDVRFSVNDAIEGHLEKLRSHSVDAKNALSYLDYLEVLNNRFGGQDERIAEGASNLQVKLSENREKVAAGLFENPGAFFSLIRQSDPIIERVQALSIDSSIKQEIVQSYVDYCVDTIEHLEDQLGYNRLQAIRQEVDRVVMNYEVKGRYLADRCSQGQELILGALTPIEQELAVLMAEQEGLVLLRERMLEETSEAHKEARHLDDHIASTEKALGDLDTKIQGLKTEMEALSKAIAEKDLNQKKIRNERTKLRDISKEIGKALERKAALQKTKDHLEMLYVEAQRKQTPQDVQGVRERANSVRGHAERLAALKGERATLRAELRTVDHLLNELTQVEENLAEVALLKVLLAEPEDRADPETTLLQMDPVVGARFSAYVQVVAETFGRSFGDLNPARAEEVASRAFDKMAEKIRSTV